MAGTTRIELAASAIDIKRCRRTSFDTTRYQMSLLIVPFLYPDFAVLLNFSDHISELCRPVAPVTMILSDIVNSFESQTGAVGMSQGGAATSRFLPPSSVSRNPQETALLLADTPRTRATAGAERNDARSGSSLAKGFAILRMHASARPRLASAGLSSFVCR